MQTNHVQFGSAAAAARTVQKAAPAMRNLAAAALGGAKPAAGIQMRRPLVADVFNRAAAPAKR